MKVRWTALICCAVILFVPIVAEAKSIIKIGNDVTLEEGQQADMILVVGGQVTVYGLVEKNVVAVGGSIILASRAVVYGDVICVGGVISRGSGADVYGDLMEINASSLAASISSILQGDMEGWSLMLHVISLCFFAIILIIALILTLLIPRSLALVAHAIEQHQIVCLGLAGHAGDCSLFHAACDFDHRHLFDAAGFHRFAFGVDRRFYRRGSHFGQSGDGLDFSRL